MHPRPLVVLVVLLGQTWVISQCGLDGQCWQKTWDGRYLQGEVTSTSSSLQRRRYAYPNP